MRLTWIISLIFFASVSHASKIELPLKNIGVLKDLYTIKNTGDCIYQFQLTEPTVVSIFLSGLSSSYQIELLDHYKNHLMTKTHKGMVPMSNGKGTFDSEPIVTALPANTYYLHLKPVNHKYSIKYPRADQFELNIIPDNAPDLITVKASDSPNIGTTTFTATGINDEVTINQAIERFAQQGKGKILLRPGTFHISNNIISTVDNLTIIGTGWNTILKLADHVQLKNAGVLRSRFIVHPGNDFLRYFVNQHFLHFAFDGNKISEPYYMNAVANFGTYRDSSFEDIRVHDFPRYGFDPHGGANCSSHTMRLLIKDCLADHNTQDGIVCDSCIDSVIENNIADNNGRHGINICTGALHNTIRNNLIINNKANGITVQPGSHLEKVSNDNIIHDNIVNFNHRNGIYIFRSKGTSIYHNFVTYNAKYGIHFRAAQENEARDNIVNDNSFVYQGEYCGIYMSSDNIINAIKNKIVTNNLKTTYKTTYKFGVAEHAVGDDYNIISGNQLTGINVPIRLKGPHTSNCDNHTE